MVRHDGELLARGHGTEDVLDELRRHEQLDARPTRGGEHAVVGTDLRDQDLRREDDRRGHVLGPVPDGRARGAPQVDRRPGTEPGRKRGVDRDDDGPHVLLRRHTGRRHGHELTGTDETRGHEVRRKVVVREQVVVPRRTDVDLEDLQPGVGEPLAGRDNVGRRPHLGGA